MFKMNILNRFKFKIAVSLAVLLAPVAALAQQAPAKVEQPWFPQSKLTSPISVTTSSAASALPSKGLIAWLCNTGSNDAYLGFGTANTISTTVATGSWLKAGTCAAYDLYPIGQPGPFTYVAIIGNGGSTTVYAEAGLGTPPGTLGGSGGASSVTQGTTPWVVGGPAAPGAVPVGNPIYFAGWDGTDIRAILTDTSGRLIVGASQNGIGNVGGKTVSVCTTPTVTASNAYGTNYVVGGLLTFANAFTSTGTGILQGVVVTIKKVETSGFTFFPFNANPSNTTWTDAAVAAINAADVPAMRTPVTLGANSQLGTATVAGVAGIGEAVAPGATSLYGILLANAALTNQFGSTSDVQVCVKILQDL
jgi:hypothetical protein